MTASSMPRKDLVLKYIRQEITLKPAHLEEFGPLLIARDMATAPRKCMNRRWFENLLLRCVRVMTDDQLLAVLVGCYAGQRCTRQGTSVDEDLQLVIHLIERRIRRMLDPEGADLTGTVLIDEVFLEAAEMAGNPNFPPLCEIVEDCGVLCAACIRSCPKAIASQMD